MQPQLSMPDEDVDMSDATASANNHTTSNNSHHLSSARETSQKGQSRDLRGTGPSSPSPSVHAKDVATPPRRSGRQSKGHSEPVSRTTRSSAIAAAAADAAKTEAATTTARRQGSPGIPSNIDTQKGTQVANRNIAATSANPSAKSSKNSNPPTKSTGTNNPTSFASQASSIESTPSMEDIIKVAAAAVAAQNAAAASAAAIAIPSNATQSHPVIDPNLDPSLSSNKGGPASKNLPAVDTKATSSGSNSATNSATTSNATTPTSSLSNNPYLSLSMLAKQSSGSSTPTGHPTMPMHPHPMYYPPNAPITPNTPTYPIYGNPYYYLAGSMAPGPSGMFLPLPPGATFSPSPAQQPPAEPPRTVKSKRLKAHSVTTRNFNIPMVPRDKGGKPMLPLNVGIMTVINLGEVCMREQFHTERYIFPVGYEVTR